MFQILFIYLLPLNWLNNVAIGQQQQQQHHQKQQQKQEPTAAGQAHI